MALRIVSRTPGDIITLTEAKLHTKVDLDLDDGLFSHWIKSAIELAEGFQNRSYLGAVIELTMDRFPANVFELPRPPLASVEYIKYYGADNTEYTFPDTMYHVDADSSPGRVGLNWGVIWPAAILRPINGFKVRYNTGGIASTVSPAVKDALLVYVTYRYYNREAEFDEAPVQFWNLLSHDRLVPV